MIKSNDSTASISSLARIFQNTRTLRILFLLFCRDTNLTRILSTGNSLALVAATKQPTWKHFKFDLLFWLKFRIGQIRECHWHTKLPPLSEHYVLPSTTYMLRFIIKSIYAECFKQWVYSYWLSIRVSLCWMLLSLTTLCRLSWGQSYKTFYGRKLQIFVISVCPWQACLA